MTIAMARIVMSNSAVRIEMRGRKRGMGVQGLVSFFWN